MWFSVLSFWLTYFGMGYYIDTKCDLSHRANMIFCINVILSFILIPMLQYIPVLITLPDTHYCLFLRYGLAFLISDVWLYMTHRFLFHDPLYRYHKVHHHYNNPSPLTGLITHPIEFVLSNYLSLMLPLLLISHHDWIIFETMFVAIDILFSHHGQDSEHPSAKYHTLHHQLLYCNYGFLYITDILFGTYKR